MAKYKEMKRKERQEAREAEGPAEEEKTTAAAKDEEKEIDQEVSKIKTTLDF